MGQKFEILVAPEKEKDLLYPSIEEGADVKRGAIGFLRGDFGNGAEFYTTFWDTNGVAELKTQDFKDELDLVVNELRKPGCLLHNLRDMTVYCYKYPSARIKSWSNDEIFGFKVETEKHSYYIRCHTLKGVYHFYVYCYCRECLTQFLKTSQK